MAISADVIWSIKKRNNNNNNTPSTLCCILYVQVFALSYYLLLTRVKIRAIRKRVKHDVTTIRFDVVLLVSIMRLNRFVVVGCFYRYCKIICHRTLSEIVLFINDRLSWCLLRGLFGTLLISYSSECYLF